MNECILLQIKKFIISGGSATFAHISVMAFLVWVGLDPLLSTSVGVIVGAVVNYILQYYYTFDSDAEHKNSVKNYLISVSLSFVSNAIVFAIVHNMFHIDVISAQLITSALVAVQNYIIYKKFVFLKNGGIYEV